LIAPLTIRRFYEADFVKARCEKWMLWNDGVEMAEFGMTRVRIGFQHALAHQKQMANGLKVSKRS
jgi:hypothetical protein